MRLKHTLLAVAVAAALSTGCATQIPNTAGVATLSSEDLKRIPTDAWGSSPAVIEDGSQAFVLHMPVTPPKDIKNKPLSIEMTQPMTIPEIAQLLGRYGIPVIVPGDSDQVSANQSRGADVEQTKSTEVAEAQGAAKKVVTNKEVTHGVQMMSTAKRVFIPKYTGTVGGFLSAVSRATDTWFTWNDGFIQASAQEEVIVSVPQDEALQKAVKTALGELSAEDVSVSLEAGLLVFKVSPSAVPKVRAFIERAVANAALVTMQVAMVSVTSDQDAKQGLDWDALQMAMGGGAGTPGNLMNALAPAGASTTPTVAGGTTPTDQLSKDPGQGAFYNGSLLRLAFANSKFSLIGFINFMNKYGSAKTVQNATVTALASYEVNLSSVTKVPYVSSVSSTVTANATSTTGTTQTSTAQDGLTIKMKPLYDRASGMVTLPIDVKVEAVISFNNLSAGNQIGSLTQPTTGERAIVDTLRMRPGETMVIGGITFDSVSRTDGLPLFLQGAAGKGLESQALTVKRNSMYIVVRPTVRLTPPIREQEGFAISGEAKADEPPSTVTLVAPSKTGDMAPAAHPAEAAHEVLTATLPPLAPKTRAAKVSAPADTKSRAKAQRAGHSSTPLTDFHALQDLPASSLAELAALPSGEAPRAAPAASQAASAAPAERATITATATAKPKAEGQVVQPAGLDKNAPSKVPSGYVEIGHEAK